MACTCKMVQGMRERRSCVGSTSLFRSFLDSSLDTVALGKVWGYLDSVI